MGRFGAQRILRKASAGPPDSELDSFRQAYVELERKHRLLHDIGQQLTAALDRDRLVRLATQFLCRDLAFDNARLVLQSDSVTTIKSKTLFPSEFSTPLALPVMFDGEIVARLMIPLKKDRQLTVLDLETLNTFGAFVAVAIGNIRRLDNVCALASIDSLTGIMNRRRFFEVGPQQITRARWKGIIVFDVDRLKMVNDTYGHLAGDALLKSIAKRAQACVRKTDFLARYGGDEFVILLPNADLESVYMIANRLRSYIESTSMEWRGQSLHSTISIGLTSLEDNVDLHDLFARADQALYEAKHAGRNSIRS